MENTSSSAKLVSVEISGQKYTLTMERHELSKGRKDAEGNIIKGYYWSPSEIVGFSNFAKYAEATDNKLKAAGTSRNFAEDLELDAVQSLFKSWSKNLKTPEVEVSPEYVAQRMASAIMETRTSGPCSELETITKSIESKKKIWLAQKAMLPTKGQDVAWMKTYNDLRAELKTLQARLIELMSTEELD